MISTAIKNGRIYFIGGGQEMMEFAAHIHRNMREDDIRQDRDGVSIPQSAVSVVAEVAEKFNVDLSAFAETIHEFRLHEEARREAMQIVDKKDVSGIPKRWAFLEHHQKIAANAMAQKNLLGACLFDEQGTGKTLTALAAFDILKSAGDIDFMMIIAPQSAINAWRDDVAKIPSSPPFTVSAVIGSRKEKNSVLYARADIYALSYETLVSTLVLTKAAAKREKCLLVVDEAFKIKNPDTARSKSIMILRSVCARAFVLSGTPSPRTPEDIIHQSDIADKGFAFQGYRFADDRLQDAEAVHNVLITRSAYLRRTKNDVLPMLPPKDLRVVRITLSGRQRELYDNVRNNLALDLRDINNNMYRQNFDRYFSKRAKLLQLCCCPSMVNEMFQTDHAKIKKLDELVEEIVVQKKLKLVIWTVYTRSVEEIARRYERHGMVVIHGETPEGKRRTAIRQFQTDSSIKIFLGNPAAAGAGITLHAAADIVYVSYTDQSADFTQSIDRTHRIGQTSDSVRYYFLVCENTIEVNQIRLLCDKVLRQHSIFGEAAEWPTVEEALDELETAEKVSEESELNDE